MLKLNLPNYKALLIVSWHGLAPVTGRSRVQVSQRSPSQSRGHPTGRVRTRLCPPTHRTYPRNNKNFIIFEVIKL